MSLFKAREWWSTTSGFEEFHDDGCLCVAKVENKPVKSEDKVIVGSFQGLLRIYEPRAPRFEPGHVVLEKQLGNPIIQIVVGQFVEGSHLCQLAVLHPKLLSVYSLVMETSNELEPTHNLVLSFSHRLKRTAYNMVVLKLGSVAGEGVSQLLCVQSMDGQLSFFHHDSPTFTCFLPDFLLPGPLSYIQPTSSLVTANSAHMLQVFKYQSLSVAGSGLAGTPEEQAGVKGGVATLAPPIPGTTSATKKVTPDWEVNLGESAQQIQVVGTSAKASHILVLGERNFFCLSHGGVVLFTKKLDFNPSCFHAYSCASDGQDEGGGGIRTLLCSHSNQLLVLEGSSLIWAASLDYTPVQITTANFQEQKGIIVSLDEQGHLTCSYLGTDPTVFSAPKNSSRDISFEEMEKELAQLNKVIKEATKEGLVVGRTESSCLKLWTEVDPDQVRVVELEDSPEEQEEDNKSIKKCLEVKVHVKSSSGATLKDVTLSISAPLPLTTHPSHFVLPEVSSLQLHQELLVTVVCTPSLLPTTTSLHLSATYNNRDGVLQVVKHQVQLPLHLFCEPVYPEKAAAYKVTIDASPCEPTMAKLFPAPLVLDHAPPQALGLAYLCGPTVTVVASKGTQRYRLQSNSLAALAATLSWLLWRLEEYFKAQKHNFVAKFNPPFPLNEYFEIIDRHFQLRKNLEQCREWLGRHAHQFRSIQKRLLARFKDKTPVGLAHLDTLLDGTYMQLMALSEKNELLELELQECSNQLSCATLLLTTLLKLCSNMSREDMDILLAALNPVVTSEVDQGWEELVDAAITYLLRTTLAKSSKEQQHVPHSTSLELSADNHKLKKHLALLCDRISKGFHPSGKSPVEATQSLTSSTPEEVSAKTFVSSGFVANVDGIMSGPGPAAGYRRHNSIGQARQPTMPALPEHASEETM